MCEWSTCIREHKHGALLGCEIVMLFFDVFGRNNNDNAKFESKNHTKMDSECVSFTYVVKVIK